MIWTDIFDGDRKNRNMLESHSHDYYELSFVFCGDITVLFDETKYAFEDNTVILTPPATNHHVLVKSGRYYRRNLYFSPEALEQLPGYIGIHNEVFESKGRVVSISKNTASRVEKIFELIDNENIPDSKLAFLWAILNIIVDEAGAHQKNTKQKESYIDAVVRVILNEYNTKLVAEALASRFFVSRTKLMIDFKNKIGKTLLEYVTFVRLEHAKEFLRSGESVLETAMMCGFQNSTSFARVFKKHISISPKEYQLKHR